MGLVREDPTKDHGGVNKDPNFNNKLCDAQHDIVYEACFDAIVIGAGTAAMGFLHGLLTNDTQGPNRNICVVERGAVDNQAEAPLLKDWFTQARSSPFQYSASFQGGSSFNIPSGQGRGGTTNIHAGLCLWPPPEDFQTDQWPHGFQSSVKKIRKELEASIQPTIDSLDKNSNSNLDTTIRFPSTLENVPCTSNTIGERINYYRALVEPLLANSSIRITWIDEAEVQRILVQANDGDGEISIATGVQYLKLGQSHQIKARTIVLAAGVLESPRLLIQSGLIPQKTIFELWDHTVVPSAMLHWPKLRQREELSRNGVASLHHFQIGRHSYQLSRFDAAVLPAVLPSLAADYLVRRHIKKQRKVLEMLASGLEGFIRMILMAFFRIPFSRSVLTVWCVNTMGPNRSIGTLKVGTDSKLTINLGYLHDDEDLQSLQHQAWPTLHQLASSKAWEVFPGAWIRQRFFASWARIFCLPYFHWSGTLSEWTDRQNLKVYNSRNIHVCDASAFPTLPRAPTAPTCAALGYHLAQSVLKTE